MYQKILVPLDGSELAECVLPHVEAIAKGCEAKTITFVRVAEPFLMVMGEWGHLPEKEIQSINARNKAVAEDYLRQVADRMAGTGASVKLEVLIGRPAESIAEYADKSKADLIVIATHGRSGVSRWVWGSVADRVLRSSCVPVLMIRAVGCEPGI